MQNISKSFYSLLIDRIVDYLKENDYKKGNKYYLILEDQKQRELFYDSFKGNGNTQEYECNISKNNLEKDSIYNTYTIKVSEDKPTLLIASIDNANEAYLTRLRNVIGLAGGNLENYCILFILGSNRLESLTTACKNIQQGQYPLSFQSMREYIRKQIDKYTINENEIKYYEHYLQQFDDSLNNELYNLFDLEDLLTIIKSEKGLINNFTKLGYFNDSSIFDKNKTIGAKELKERISNNHSFYERTNNILNNIPDSETRAKEFNHFLDEDFSKKMSRLKANDNWNLEYKLDDFLKSNEKAKAKGNLQLEGAYLAEGENLYLNLKKNLSGSNAKKTNNHILIFNEQKLETVSLVLDFNQKIKRELIKYNKGNQDFTTKGNQVIVNISERTDFSIGKDKNVHSFKVLPLTTKEEYFKDLGNDFKLLNKKVNTISVDIPADETSICIGDKEGILSRNGKSANLKDNEYLTIDTNELEEVESFNLSINENEEIVLKIKSSSRTVYPLKPINIFQQIWEKKESFKNIQRNDSNEFFSKIGNSEKEYSTTTGFRDLLKLEKQMILEEAAYLEYQENDYSKNAYCKIDLDLPQPIKDSLLAIFKYFSCRDTVPSLAYIDDELEQLYQDYIRQVNSTVSNIKTNSGLDKIYHNISKLGLLKRNNKIQVSPFHPCIISFLLQLKQDIDDTKNDFENIIKLIDCKNILPYISIDNIAMEPFAKDGNDEVKTWISYRPLGSKLTADREITVARKMIREKADSYLRHFKYVFHDLDSPLRIGIFGLENDIDAICGLIEWMVSSKKELTQKVAIYEYVKDITNETFYERLNRLNNETDIINELDKYNVKIESKERSASEIIRLLFTRVTFHKKTISEIQQTNEYFHLAFYKMDTGHESITPNSSEIRLDASLNGLFSMPSSSKKGDDYTIGFGSKGLRQEGYIYPTAISMNNIYGNEKNNGNNQYKNNSCIAKQFRFKEDELLESILKASNWTVFLDPEVDLDFFYQKDMYIIHYTDQHCINASYDSVTVTTKSDLYSNMLYCTLNEHIPELSQDSINSPHIVNTINYFNCLNGKWLLNMVKKTDYQAREKLSVVVATNIIKYLFSNDESTIWIPLSLEEILRVSGAIGLPLNSLLSKVNLGEKGEMSDDLLFVGLDIKDEISVHLYPVEVKMSKSTCFKEKGESQVAKTYNALKKNLIDNNHFVNKVYRTFIVSQALSTLDKLNANRLIDESSYNLIQKYRYELLNCKYNLKEANNIDEVGQAALVMFYGNNSLNIAHSNENEHNINICNITLSYSDGFAYLFDEEEKLKKEINSYKIFAKAPKKPAEEALYKIEIEKPKDTLLAAEPSLERQSKDINNDIISETKAPNNNRTPELKKEKEVPNLEQKTKNCPHKGIKIQIGNKQRDHAPIIFEPNNTKQVEHPNMAVVGTMGTGKTQLAKSLLYQFNKESQYNPGKNPMGILVFDYKGDYNQPSFVNSIDGHCYKNRLPFNPLKFIPTENDKYINLPSITADSIADSMKKVYNLGIIQVETFKELITDAYADMGITEDYKTWDNEPPTLSYVIDKYLDSNPKKDSLYSTLKKLKSFNIFSENNKDCVTIFEWLKGIRVIDLTIYSEEAKKFIVSMILDLFYAEMRILGESELYDGQYRALRCMILVDEAHQFIKKDFKSFRNIISEGRMFGVGMILSTQSINDFKTSENNYAEYIMSWVIHKVTNINSNQLKQIFGQNNNKLEEMSYYISNAEKFRAICKINTNTNKIVDLPYYKLLQNT